MRFLSKQTCKFKLHFQKEFHRGGGGNPEFVEIGNSAFLGGIEGTGTQPDYLVNRVLTKNEGPHRKKNCSEIEK